LRDGREMVINVANKDKDTLFKIHNCKLNSTLTLKEEAAKFHSSNVFTLSGIQIKEAIDDILTHFHHVVLKTKKKSVDSEVEGKEEKHIVKVIKKNLKVKEHEVSTQNKKAIPKYSLQTLSKFIAALRPFKYHNKVKVNLKESTLVTMKKHVLNKLYQVRLSDSPQKKLFSSHLFSKLITFFNELIDKKTKTKLMVLTAFDINIVDLISNLFDNNFLRKSMTEALHDKNLYRFLAPPLASSIIFELVQIDNDKNYYIRIIYNGKEVNSNFAKPVRFSPSYKYLNYNDLRMLINSRIDKNYDMVNCHTDNK
jgi:6-pyruvoyl-tetrahydropterin synthase